MAQAERRTGQDQRSKPHQHLTLPERRFAARKMAEGAIVSETAKHRLHARLDLAEQIFDRAIGDACHQRLHQFGIAISEPPCLGLLAAALPGDHIGRDGPGTACKAEEGGLGGQ